MFIVKFTAMVDQPVVVSVFVVIYMYNYIGTYLLYLSLVLRGFEFFHLVSRVCKIPDPEPRSGSAAKNLRTYF
jgi:hypothetical protein